MDLQDLLQIGIESYDDAFKVLQEIKYLPATIKRMGMLHRFNIFLRLSFINISLVELKRGFKSHSM